MVARTMGDIIRCDVLHTPLILGSDCSQRGRITPSRQVTAGKMHTGFPILP